jgi:hypothetical protein
MTLPIQDEYAGLEISKQRKYQLRHPEREAERVRRYDQSEAGKEHQDGNVTPDTVRSRRSFPQAREIKTLDLFPEFANI